MESAITLCTSACTDKVENLGGCSSEALTHFVSALKCSGKVRVCVRKYLAVGRLHRLCFPRWRASQRHCHRV
uniref:Uncharacterized protein n=1 Tax=Denticeps clupeoides TaxID=299321 RepID=A0AAY4BHJ7_9TELE